MLCVGIGLVAAVAVVTSIPLYAEAINYAALRQEVFKAQSRPPFGFLYRYVGAWSGPISWDRYLPADRYMTEQAAGTIGLPLRRLVRHVKTDRFQLFPASEATYGGTRTPLEWVDVGFISDLQEHIEILDGYSPPLAEAGDAAFSVLVHENLANRLGLQPGERYILFGGRREGAENLPAQLTIYISGVWRPVNPRSNFWFYQAFAFEKTLLVPEETLERHIAPKVKDEVFLAVWYLLFDGEGVRTEHVDRLLARIGAANREAATILANLSLDFSPVELLEEHKKTATLLTILLYVFAIPIVGLVLYFIVLVSGMIVQRGRHEIAMLRSRGTSSAQVVGIYLVEGLVLGAVALGVGPYIARVLAQIMRNARSFLSFAPSAALPLRFSAASVRAAVGAVALGLAAGLVPALSASGYTIVTHKQDVARAMRKPFWQRYYVDLMLLIPPLYGYYLLRQRGTVAVLGRELTYGSDPFQNPLLFLVPTLFLLAWALLFARAFPALMEALAWLGSKLPGAAPLLALRHLSRASEYYIGPLLLIVLTLGLATFSSSMAETLEQHLLHRVYYEVGADLRLVESGASPAGEEDLVVASSSAPSSGGAAAEGEGQEEENAIRWLFLPVLEHLAIPGVQGAARVGTYEATARVVDGTVEGRFVGVDRLDFMSVAFFRRDFSDAPLGALMNILALRSDALLVHRSFLAEHGLKIGDRLELLVRAFGDTRRVSFTVAETLDYFPGVYPEDGPFFVGNLEYLFQEMGRQYPYDVWLKTDGRDAQEIARGVEEMGLRVLSVQDAHRMVEQEQSRPEQGGAFGLLSIGFVTAAALTMLGFLLHSMLTFRERFIEMGVLRAVGLSVGQMAAFLGCEQFLLLATGLGVGTGLGVWTSRVFVPFLQVRGGPHPQTPPFVVEIAWGDVYKVYAIFGGMLILAIMIMVSSLIRMKVFQAIKLGDTG